MRLLREFRKLPETPHHYPKSPHFTAQLLFNTAQEFVIQQQKLLSKAHWLPGGTQHYVFVRTCSIPSDSVIAFRGDLHGDVHSLIRWLDMLRAEGWFEKNNPFVLTKESLKKHRYLCFLGDYVDRGHYGSETMLIIMRLWLNNPKNIIIVRGNHEDKGLTASYGFMSDGHSIEGGELYKKFNGAWPHCSEDLVEILSAAYACLPVAVFIGCDNGKLGKDKGIDFIQCCHGGMEPLYDARLLLGNSTTHDVYQWINRDITDDIERMVYTRDGKFGRYIAHSCLCDEKGPCKINGFQWNDFDFFNEEPWGGIKRGNRGSYVLHQDYTTHLLDAWVPSDSAHRICAIFRAHQHSRATVRQILQYGNGLYKLWENKGPCFPLKKGYDWIVQWSGKPGEPVEIGLNSVWTFNIAPRTGVHEKMVGIDFFSYDTVAQLRCALGFENWRLYPQQIRV